ncbi:hypothetical protein CLV68_3249 [Actinokineospora cianjurensis]|uniref:Transcriptional regulator n=1 Tax=Actinokineospora cianjurensis TaxID=585224 RepID=A0A421B338_9PSEU|nr:hypothetical protein CLV68_3249 [Actinokineospora cianjurensis]
MSPAQLAELLNPSENGIPASSVNEPTLLQRPDGRSVMAEDTDATLVRGVRVLRPAVSLRDWETMSPLSRRSLLKQGLLTAVFPALGLEDLERVAGALVDAGRYLDGSVVTALRHQLAAVKADDGTLGPGATRPIVLELLGVVEQHARQVASDVRVELLTLGIDCAEFAGWLYRDARDLPRALYWHDRAVEWAQEVGNLPAQGYVLLKKAQLAYDQREPARMLGLAQATLTGPWQVPYRVQAEAVQQRARAEAMLGAPVAAVERQLNEARQLLERTDARDDSSLGAHYGPALLDMQTAVCFAEAGVPRRALAIYEQALRAHTFSSRDYGFFLSWQASSMALAGEPDQAAATGLEAAARADTASSRRTQQELVRVLDVLKPWQHRSAVQELRHAVTI